jgi:hypothetical protein
MCHASNVTDLADALAGLRGRACWSALSGPSTGSVVQLQFEPKLLRTAPVDNDALSDDERRYDAEFVLYVSCAWRLEQAHEVICSAGDVERDAVRSGTLIERLVGKKVTDAHLSEPAGDVLVTFENGYRLHIFCDEPAGYTNYALLGPSLIYSVRAPARVLIEKRHLDGSGP